jgi:DNA repair photolyase
MDTQAYLKGRGAQINPSNPFHNFVEEHQLLFDKDAWEALSTTNYIEVYPKTILNKVSSPDIPFSYSLNPYQGCEHGCVYCYARNSHTYWGYSSGIEFEQKILVKKSAPKLLEEQLKKKSWEATPIMLAGNTDCYQPAEKQYEITRQILEVFLRYRHPVGLITKNSLILRDLDLLDALNEHNLVHVAISVTTLQEDLRRFLEPRTASISKRLKTIEVLADKGIPVNVMMAPIIPGLNDHEIMDMAKKVAGLGANSIAYTMVRLNGDVATIFEDWIRKNYPDRAEKVLNKIRSCHGGELNDSRFGKRMVGEGRIAEIVRQQFKLAKKLYFKNTERKAYNLDLYKRFKYPQLELF